MRSTEFAYWLQGFFELADPTEPLSLKQVETIKNHLKLVFLYEIDPSYSKDKVVQAIFQNIHDGKDALSGLKITEKPVQTRTDFSSSRDRIIKC